MTTRILGRGTMVWAIVGGTLLAVGRVEAEHGHGGRGPSGRGERCVVPGEPYVLLALDHLQHAAGARCRADRSTEVRAARRAMSAAQHEFRDREAKRQLAQSFGPLARFDATGAHCDLELVMTQLHAALRHERGARSAVRWRSPYPTHRGAVAGTDVGGTTRPDAWLTLRLGRGGGW